MIPDSAALRLAKGDVSAACCAGWLLRIPNVIPMPGLFPVCLFYVQVKAVYSTGFPANREVQIE
jgi:hypothetical protein